MKTTIYSLIILDESGSMDPFQRSTINGCNETLNAIRNSQMEFGETQDHYVSIFLFQSGSTLPSRYLVKNAPIAEVRNITTDDYQPYGCTPLFDAVGSTLIDLKSVVKERELAIGNVTIITDGEENSSRIYSGERVARMIKELKELGWNFNFIGANIDVKRWARSLNIDNFLKFQQNEEGVKEMFAREGRARNAWAGKIHNEFRKLDLEGEDLASAFSKKAVHANRGYFEEPDAKQEDSADDSASKD